MAKSPKGSGNRRGGNPPEQYRFRPGQSGNPGGRPKKTRTLRDVARDLLNETVCDPESGEEVPAAEQYVRHLLNRSLRNEYVALAIIRWLEGSQPTADQVDGDEPDTDVRDDQDVIEDALRRIQRRKRRQDAAAAASIPDAGNADD
ncbi:MAG: DUF5681 domain-containing protein [Caulobacteraceae bacterium]